MPAPTLSRAITDAQPSSAAVRMGTVAEISPVGRWLMVRIANASVATPATWVSSYRPMLGDVVAVSRQDATWVVLGALGVALDVTANPVPNYTFDLGDVGSLPPYWTLVTSAGSPTLTSYVYPRDDVIDGERVARLLTAGSGTVTTEMVSDPIAVVPSQSWAVGGWVRTLTDFAMATTCTVQVYAAWYSDLDLPSFLSQEGSGTYAVTRGMDWTLVRAQRWTGIVAPLGAAYLRVKFAFSWSAAAGDAIYIDRVIARSL